MNSEQEWAARLTGEDVDAAAEGYRYFMRKEPRDGLGPIQRINDPILGSTRVREVRIGMTRNAAEENKRTVTAFLEPYPHTRIDTAKPLQGWYKSLHEAPGVRNRP